MRDIMYFLKGIIKILTYLIGLVIWGIPMLFVLFWIIIASCGGLDKAADEYDCVDWWISWFDKANDNLWKW